MKKLLLLAAVLLISAGCENLQKYEAPTEKAIETAEKFAPVADKITGGWASTVAGIAGVAVSSIFAINRQIVAQRRKKVIEEVHATTNTPDVGEQVTSATAKAEVNRVIST